MEDNHIFISELLILTLWLCAPFIVSSSILAAYLLGKRLRVLTLFLVLIFAIAAQIVVALFLWSVLPLSLLPSSVLPESGKMFLPFFFPGLAACLAVWIVMGMVLTRTIASKGRANDRPAR